jgi:hypothetical protein
MQRSKIASKLEKLQHEVKRLRYAEAATGELGGNARQRRKNRRAALKVAQAGHTA